MPDAQVNPDAQAQPPQGGAKPDQPPFGSSPATGPTQNLGRVAAGMARIGLLVQSMTETLQLVGATSEPGQDLLDAIKKLSKHIQPGSVSDSEKKNQLQGMLMKQQQMAPHMAAMRSQQAGGGQPQAAPSAAA